MASRRLWHLLGTSSLTTVTAAWGSRLPRRLPRHYLVNLPNTKYPLNRRNYPLILCDGQIREQEEQNQFINTSQVAWSSEILTVVYHPAKSGRSLYSRSLTA